MTVTVGKLKVYLCSRGEQGFSVPGTASYLCLKKGMSPHVQANLTKQAHTLSMEKKWNKTQSKTTFPTDASTWTQYLTFLSAFHQEIFHLNELMVRVS